MTIKWLAIPVLAMTVCVIGSSPSKAFAASPQAPGYGQGQGGWDQPPSDFRDVQRQGFHDGIEAARRDFDHHHRASADDHEEYRHPHVDRAARDDYRDGFRRGYDAAMRHMGGYDHH
jgi:hypothetical protein